MTWQPLRSTVRAALIRANLFRPDARLLAGVSGGADSVALLHLLRQLQPEGGYTLLAAHVQHGLRGEASLEDERFTRKLCACLGVPLLVERAALSGDMEASGIETRAREERRRIFAGLMEREGADALVLAHHLDDQAETVLLRLMRGAGADGLCGMRACVPFGRGVLLRPLLGVSRAELRAALQEAGEPWREDMSNQRPTTPRNALRLDVLPRMEALYPGAARHIAQTAEALAVDADALAGEADALYRAALVAEPPLFALRKSALRSASPALTRRVLRRWALAGAALRGYEPQERTLSREDTLSLCALLDEKRGACRNLPMGLCAEVGESAVYLRMADGSPLIPAPPPAPLVVSAEERAYHVRGLRVTARQAVAGESAPRDASEAVLPERWLTLHPVLRAPLAGDIIHPMGASGAKPLRRWMTDRKLDQPLRPLLPVLAVGSEILWVPMLCTSERLRVSEPTGAAMRLSASAGAPYLPLCGVSRQE